MKKEKEKKDMMPKDQVVAILEEIRGDFKVFGEGLDDVRRGVKNLEVRFDAMNERLEKNDIKLDSVAENVNFLIEDMDEVKANIVEMKIDIKDTQIDVRDIKEKLDKKSEKEVTDKHEKRIFKLEKAAFATQ